MQARLVNERLHGIWMGRSAGPVGYCSVKVSHFPGFAGWFLTEARNEMEVQVPCPLAEGDGVDAVTACELSYQLGSLLYGWPPSAGFCSGELQRATHMATGIQQ